MPVAISLTRSLSFKLIRTALLCAICLGLVICAGQISYDYTVALAEPDKDMGLFVALLRQPAAAMTFSLDRETAKELLNGSLRHPAVSDIRITLADGSIFAEAGRVLAAIDKRSVSDSLFGATRVFSAELNAETPEGKEVLGYLEITVDTYYYGRVFMDRLSITLASTLFYALALSSVVLALFYLRVTRPLLRIIDSIVQIGAGSSDAVRLEVPKGHDDDELGVLVTVTNKHLETIEKTLRDLRKVQELLQRHSDSLEFTVAERTRALTESLNQLQATQNQLIESEKLAALGGLVAGVAHEVNTPLGIAVTASSALAEAIREMRSGFEEHTLTGERFDELLTTIEDGNSILSHNIDRAAHLIRDFKRTAVDQVSEACCDFDVRQVIDALITSLHPETSKRRVSPIFECPNGLMMYGLPGVLTQVMTNLVLNSLRHAFEGVEKPEIIVRSFEDKGRVIFEYQDNGVGVPKELHERIFEPFFTTKRGQGGSGLGLNIVYNLVTRKLLGRLEFSSDIGKGVLFRLDLPRVLPTT